MYIYYFMSGVVLSSGVSFNDVDGMVLWCKLSCVKQARYGDTFTDRIKNT